MKPSKWSTFSVRLTAPIDSFDVNGAVRVSDYNTIGSTTAWQAGANWKLNDDIRFRFTRSRSVRAPNLVELYAPMSVTEGSYFNPCAALTMDATPNRRRNCIALGTPESGGIYQVPLATFISGGNPELQEETSDSLTIGAVITPSRIPNLRLSADYYDISISGAVSSFSSTDTLQRCVDADSISGNIFCDQLRFNAIGEVETFYTNLINSSRFNGKGIDFGADYRFALGTAGIVGLNISGSYLIEKEYIGVEGDPNTYVIYTGEYTDPKLRVNFTVNYNRDNYGLSLSNRFVGSSDIDAQALPEARDVSTVPSRIYSDLLFRVDVSDDVSAFVGANNILNRIPPQTQQTYRYGAYHDIVGRYFHAGVKIKF